MGVDVMAVWGDAMQKHGFRRSVPVRHHLPSDLSATRGTTLPRRRQLQGREAVNLRARDARGTVPRLAMASTRLAAP